MLFVIDKNIPLGVEAFSTLGDVRTVETASFNAGIVRDADVLIVRSETRVTPALLETSRVRFVGTATIGTDHVDTRWLTTHGIGFASAPGSNANSACEYVVAALLEVAGRFGFALNRSTLGIVGVGNIGGRVARAAVALGMRVLLNDPPLARATGDPKYRPLVELMDADLLTLHVPLTRTGDDPTYHLFDTRRFAAMKRGSILLNASRGAVVETSALKDALLKLRLRAAALDVWENEPAIDTDLLLQTALATPHIAGYSLDGKVNAVRMIYAAVCRHFALRPAWDVPFDRLPVPRTTRVDLPAAAPADDAVLRNAVRQCYDITLDDRLLREIIVHPPPERAPYFMGLRSGYRVRREFFATEVTGGSTPLRSVLATLGFTISHEKIL